MSECISAAPSARGLPPALAGERREFRSTAGRLSYYVAGEGEPLLLVHSVNAAASAYEVKPIFDNEIARRRVYALELPGFGFSERSDRAYDIRLMTDAIHAMGDEIAREGGGQLVHGLAISLSCEFLARATAEKPGRFATLTFVTPTGFERAEPKPTTKETREVPGLFSVLNVPLWSRGLFDLLVSRRSIRFFLEKTWGSKAIDEGLLDYDYITTHQPGAKNAPYAFVSGRLFSANIRGVYAKLTTPVWVPHGSRGDFAALRGTDWIEARSNWSLSRYVSGALPHFERTQEFIRDLDVFLAGSPVSHSSGPVSPSAPSPSRSPIP